MTKREIEWVIKRVLKKGSEPKVLENVVFD